MKPNTTSPKNRREFLQHSLLVLGALPVFGTLMSACEATGDTPPDGDQAAKEDDPVAASLGYRSDATKVDVEKFAKRKGPDGEKQFCTNCQFFTAKGTSGWGACQIIRSGDVKATGWCNTWAQKA